ncbi:alginate export family protein [Sphingomonas sp. HF-S4]|uniref:Alginate export family protein n=1 Tax=Sphingomonas agrestis TaxID=3080540 RepID=A0ABU3Y362_9SPHN|nr:alginate export family protein [Sphingomonas sp. HF-S4]MDV3455823.1 alginate export family protein [Sphingomonas sp. HF-S4]
MVRTCFYMFASLTLAGTPMLSSIPASAQDVAEGLSVTGSMRLRYEAIDGQARAGFNESDELVNLRTAILAEYRTRTVRLGVELYDSRVWGDRAETPVTTNEVNALEPIQAYVAGDIDGAFGKGTKLTLTAGRMTLNLGARRLVAADDYRNTTNGYTGIRAEIAAQHGWKATLIYTLPQVRLPDDDAGIRDAQVRLDRQSFDLVLWGGQVSKARAFGSGTAELTWFHLGERDGPGNATRDRSLDTFGGRIMAEPRADGFDYEVEAFYQTGHASTSLAPTAPRQAVSASFVHADAGYSFRGPWKPRLSVEFDRASGDRLGGRYGRFDTLFGMRRADLAPAGLYNAVGRANLMTIGLRVEATPSRRLDWFAAYRPMWLAADRDGFSTTGVRDMSGRSGDFAGNQLEARLRYWLMPARLRFEFDGALLAKGRFLREAPNAPAGRWTRYGSFNLTASF